MSTRPDSLVSSATSATSGACKSHLAQQQRVAVIGASLGGLASANVFHQLGFLVRVYERSHSTFEDRGSSLGFCDVDLWAYLMRGKTMMRRGVRATRQQGAFYYGDLWKFLYAGLPEGTVRFGHTVESLGSEDPIMKPTIGGEKYDLVVIADGGWSGMRRYVIDDDDQEQPRYAGYVVWRGMVSADRVSAPPFQSYGIYKNGPMDIIAMQLATDDGQDNVVCGVFIATPEDEVTRPEKGTQRHEGDGKEGARQVELGVVPEWFLPLVRKNFRAHASGELVRLFEAVVADGKLTPHPQYEYGAKRVTRGRLVLVGDAAHMASPRTAVGAHTAVLDAVTLRAIFERFVIDSNSGSSASVGASDGATRFDIDGALQKYSANGAQRARELFERSREVSRQFVPSGGISAIVSPSKLV